MAVTEGKEAYNIVLIRIPQIDVSQENYAPIYFKKNRNRSMYVPFFLAPWLLGSLQLRKNRFSVQFGLRLAFTKTEKERQKKRQYN